MGQLVEFAGRTISAPGSKARPALCSQNISSIAARIAKIMDSKEHDTFPVFQSSVSATWRSVTRRIEMTITANISI